MKQIDHYDAAVIGGGLAGLSCALMLARSGHSVVLLEKEKYPYHKVCGEYVSMESRDYLVRLGLALDDPGLPHIDTLLLTAPNGRSFVTRLPLGGFGISRYLLDSRLAALAVTAGAHVLEETRAEQVVFDGEKFEIGFTSRAAQQKSLSATVCFGAYGKRSNLDVRWNRSFLKDRDTRLQNHVGIKYHVFGDWDPNVIGLHNFRNGYCGISAVEAQRFCLCYMTTAENLKKNQNSIAALERNVLRSNPHLERIFSSIRVAEGFPVTISQIGFLPKSRVEHHVLMLGDAAGMITPLCGNGMSIALHTGKTGAELASSFLHNRISREEMEAGYAWQWQDLFARRLQTGRALQRFFGSERLSNAFVQLFRTFPFLAAPVIRLTHGKPF